MFHNHPLQLRFYWNGAGLSRQLRIAALAAVADQSELRSGSRS